MRVLRSTCSLTSRFLRGSSAILLILIIVPTNRVAKNCLFANLAVAADDVLISG